MVDFDMLSSMFCRTEAEVKAEEAAKIQRLAAQASVRTKSVLDGKKINDVAIQLSSFKAAPSEVVEALLTIDEYAMTEDKLGKLLKMSPTEEEEKTLRENAGIINELSA